MAENIGRAEVVTKVAPESFFENLKPELTFANLKPETWNLNRKIT